MNGDSALAVRRPTLVGGDVAALGHGFDLGGIVRGAIGVIGTLTGVRLGGGPAPTPTPGPRPGVSTGRPLPPISGDLLSPRISENLRGAARLTAAVAQRLIALGAPAQAITALIGSPISSVIQLLTQSGLAHLVGTLGAGHRRRRMNPLNLRALGRADRRLTSFAKIARRYVRRDAPQRVVRTGKRRR